MLVWNYIVPAEERAVCVTTVACKEAVNKSSGAVRAVEPKAGRTGVGFPAWEACASVLAMRGDRARFRCDSDVESSVRAVYLLLPCVDVLSTQRAVHCCTVTGV